MTYNKIRLIGPVNDFRGRVDAARRDGNYIGHEAEFDRLVSRVLTEPVQQAVEYVAASSAVAEKAHGEAKKLMKDAETLAKVHGKWITEEDVDLLDFAQQQIDVRVSRLAADSQALEAALSEFRDEFFGAGDEAVHDPSVLAPLIAARQASIVSSKRVGAVADRLGEYQVRMASLLALARKQAGRADVDRATLLGDFDREVHRALSVQHSKIHEVEPLKSIVGLSPKRALAPKDLKARQDSLSNSRIRAKHARGALKTADQLIANFTKVSADFAGDAKRGRDMALDRARAAKKEFIAKLTDFDKWVAKADKNMQTIAKLH